MNAKPFYYYLPNWAHESLRTRCCSQCQNNYTKEDIVAIGIRQTKDKASAMFVEHKCSLCDFRASTTLGKQKEDTLEGLCYVILEYIKRKKQTEKSRSLRKITQTTPISDSEVDEFLDFIKSSKSYEDFLKEIGVETPDNKDDSS